MAHPGNSGSKPELGMADERSRQILVISHELRNSLAVIRNAARLLRSPSSDGTVDGARSLIDRQVAQMSRHIDDLLEPQPRGTHGLGLRRSRIDLRTIARYAADAITPELARRRHRLVVHLPEEPVWAYADGVRLEQVFSNLLINAAKYTPNGGKISLLVRCIDESLYVHIRDSGVGIEPAMLSRVFGLFVQVAPVPGRDNGCGIGLAVVRAVVEQHGGTVTATSAGLGLGSEFTIVLPLCRRNTTP
jgi:signal transduction histidine kinase